MSTPLPSLGATGAISQIQISLNNLIGQLRESIFIVTETAPCFKENSRDLIDDYELITSGELDDNLVIQNKNPIFLPDSAENMNKEIIERAKNISTLLFSIKKNSELLPCSARNKDDIHKEILGWQEKIKALDKKLEVQRKQIVELNDALDKTINYIVSDQFL